jgi:hypothetical protein
MGTCQCGCGSPVIRGKFAKGHYQRGIDGFHRLPPDVKVCDGCGRPYQRSEFANRQSNKHWHARRFCSEECRRRHGPAEQRRGADSPHWKGAAVTPQAGRKRARVLYGGRPCEVCGATPADVHHIDGDPVNNDPANIQNLCRLHHFAVEDRMVYRRGVPGSKFGPRDRATVDAVLRLRKEGMTYREITATLDLPAWKAGYYVRTWGDV